LKQLSDGLGVRRLAWLLLVLASSAPLADCSLFRRAAGGKHAAKIVVEVRNDNWLDMNIYLVRNGNQERLGTVGSFGRGTFRLDASRLQSGDVRLKADPIGSNVIYVSPVLIVNPGQTVRLHVMNSLSLSTVAVY
jgi:hypothetical protein